jgi:hypothetical protein
VITGRYIVTPPTKGGYAFWNVRDTSNALMPDSAWRFSDFAVATFHCGMPCAEGEARNLCSRLNGEVASMPCSEGIERNLCPRLAKA